MCIRDSVNVIKENLYQFIANSRSMIRFLAKWSLEITGASLVGYHTLLSPQQQADFNGMYRSVRNSTRASYVVFRSIYDYY